MAVTREVAAREMAERHLADKQLKREQEKVQQEKEKLEKQEALMAEAAKLKEQQPAKPAVAEKEKPEGQGEAKLPAIILENPGIFFQDQAQFETFFNTIKSEVMAFVPDVSTEKGRKEIRSLAHKVVRTRTAIDNAGKELNAERNRQIEAVDELRRKMRTRLQVLEDQARYPVVEWERTETARINRIKGELLLMEGLGNCLLHGNARPITQCMDELRRIQIDDSYGEFEEEARKTRKTAEEKLALALAAYEKAEADRIELEKLRTEKAEAEQLRRQQQLEDEGAASLLNDIKEMRAGYISGQHQHYAALLAELKGIDLEVVVERHRAAVEMAVKEAHAFLSAKEQREVAERLELEKAAQLKAEDEAAYKMLERIQQIKAQAGGKQPYALLFDELEKAADPGALAERHRSAVQAASAQAKTDLEAQLEKEAAERKRQEEEQERAKEEAERKRIAAAEELAARNERERLELAHKAELEKIQREKWALEEAQRQEVARQEREKAEAEAKERQKKAENEARERNKVHREVVMKAATDCIVNVLAANAKAKNTSHISMAEAVVDAIVNDKIDWVSIRF